MEKTPKTRSRKKATRRKVNVDPSTSDANPPEVAKDSDIAPQEEALARMRAECDHDPKLAEEVTRHMQRYYDSVSNAANATSVTTLG